MKNKDRSNLFDFFMDKCGEHNLKMTPQRVLIYKELVRSKDHPNADVVFRRVKKTFPNISFDTVNRTLLTFSKIGVISVVEGYCKSKRFDPNMEEHHHFRCMKCSSITDFHNRYFDNIKIPDELKQQFNVLNKRVVLEGICKRCSKEE